jgi:hypothetical protein
MTDPELCPIPPDAGGSFLGFYGLGNPWTIWLLGTLSELCALTPRELQDPARAPYCPEGSIWNPHRMVFRPTGWVCYRHEQVVDGEVVLESTVRLPFESHIPRAPGGDALAHVGDGKILETLDD